MKFGRLEISKIPNWNFGKISQRILEFSTKENIFFSVSLIFAEVTGEDLNRKILCDLFKKYFHFKYIFRVILKPNVNVSFK